MKVKSSKQLWMILSAHSKTLSPSVMQLLHVPSGTCYISSQKVWYVSKILVQVTYTCIPSVVCFYSSCFVFLLLSTYSVSLLRFLVHAISHCPRYTLV
eukprot:m.95348 g.95348  ORF g.95348 m.95348 type:complete len:98 (+) comp13057_c0_seq1:1736-2029(+)